MARRVGFVLVFLGLFLLFFGLFDRVYIYPRLKKAPLDQYSQPVATGTGTYFNRSPDKLEEVNGAELRNIRTVRGDVKAGSDEVAVWDSFNSTVAVADNGVIHLIDAVLINTLVKDSSEQRNGRARLDAAARMHRKRRPAQFGLESQADRAHRTHIAEGRNIIE
mgnify:CR=1 FL=1